MNTAKRPDLNKVQKLCIKYKDSIYKHSFGMVGSIFSMFGITLGAGRDDHAWWFLQMCSPILIFCFLLCMFTARVVRKKARKR